MKKTFIAPRIDTWLFSFAESIPGTVLKVLQNIREMVIQPDDLKELQSLKKERVLFFSNHPSTAEPPLVAILGKQLGKRFYFMASRQVFEWMGGIIGFLIKRLGAYSVIAGIPDKRSLKMTRDILSAEAGKLVIFPEGEPTSGENDTLMPFQPGVAQLGLWGLKDARKKDPNADIYIVPSFWRFELIGGEEKIKANILKRVKKLEKKLSIDPGDKTLLRRFLTIGRIMVEKYEKRFEITPLDKEDFDYRVGRIRHSLLDDIAEIYQVKGYNKDDNAILKFRKLFSIAELLMINYKADFLPKLPKKVKKKALQDLVEAFDLIVIKRDHLLVKPTAEKMLEWLDRYEMFIFGKKSRAFGGLPSQIPKKAHLVISKPFKISEYLKPGEKQGKETVKNLTDRLRKELEQLVEQSAHLNKEVNW